MSEKDAFLDRGRERREKYEDGDEEGEEDAKLLGRFRRKVHDSPTVLSNSTALHMKLT